MLLILRIDVAQMKDPRSTRVKEITKINCIFDKTRCTTRLITNRQNDFNAMRRKNAGKMGIQFEPTLHSWHS